MKTEMTPLEALEKLTNYKCSRMSEKIECKEIIETALKRIPELEEQIEKFSEYVANTLEIDEQEQKKLKALEIIKNKNVHLVLLRACFGIPNNKYAIKVYNEKVENKLIQKEYDLLKELKI